MTKNRLHTCYILLWITMFLVATILLIWSKYSNDGLNTTVCIGRLAEIENAMHQYHEKHGHFPSSIYRSPEGHEHSWRVCLLEFLNEEAYRKYRFDEPWDSFNNRSIEYFRPKCYNCDENYSNDKNNYSTFYVVTGSDTLFPPTHTQSISNVIRPNETIMLVESTHVKAHWMSPVDIPYDTLVQLKTNHRLFPISCGRARGPICRTVDGTTLWVDKIPRDQFLEQLIIKK